ncbi:MAG: isochorismatase family protein [Pseudorhodoplanes sp.]|uniref:isochorismatase family protein n=1 Tax=Pseudorhodoplanes sp. TaxID=1934341 RepID=UPI003D125A3C
MGRPWDGLISEADLAVYQAAGFGHRTGFGKRPALLVIDVQYRTAGSVSRPIMEAIKEYPTACGEYAWRAIPKIAELIAVFRSCGLPILHPCVAPKGEHDDKGFGAKAPGILDVPPKGYEFVAEIAPRGKELILPKIHASAFFGTALASYLVSFSADSLVIVGCATSGCVRATAVDGCSLNYPVVIPEDAVYDRGQVPHAISLFDLASKYADVVPTSEVISQVKSNCS